MALLPTEDNKTLARRYFEDLATGGRLEVAAEILDPAVVESAQTLLKRLRQAFPDFATRVEDVIAEGNKVVVRFTASGTHLGKWQSPFGLFAPTGKQFLHEGIRIFRIENGKLVETCGGADELTRLMQLGIVDQAKFSQSIMQQPDMEIPVSHQDMPDRPNDTRATAFLFDLDGTLVDSVYQHVLAWREALEAGGIELSVWRIHRRIGMSGGLFVNALLRETGRQVTPEEATRLQRLHAEAYARQAKQIRPLPGARELLAYLSQVKVPWAVATSGRLETARPTLDMLGIGPNVPIVTRDQVQRAKPDPDLFLAAAERLDVPISDSVVVGDSVWDLLAARRARALGVGLLSGGYGQDELERAGAYRVYQDPADLLQHLDEVGVRVAE